MPLYDISEEQAALDPPKLKVGRRVYVGRILSADEFFPWEAKLRKAHRLAAKQFAAEDPEGIAAAAISVRDTVRQYVNVIFPRGWRVWRRRRASYYVMRLPSERFAELLKDFLVSQDKALGSNGKSAQTRPGTRRAKIHSG